MDRPRNLDDRGADRGQHVDSGGGRFAYLALAPDAGVACGDGREERTQEDSKRGASPRAPEAAEDHPQSIASTGRATAKATY